jgi:pyridinium-3,5-biscarboxylic acid mononucleotide sulfurtransferase
MIVLEDLDRKERQLRDLLRSLESVVVAFSGGVDSALVLKIAGDELGERALGITARSESLAASELENALGFAAAVGARHEVLETRELDDPNYRANPENRCYFCKKELYGRLSEIARERDAKWIVDGFNLDDASDWRPGRKAAGEFGVRSPLAEAGFAKSDVRALAKKLGLDVWDKPALACLSSRFPYGTPITLELLQQVDRAEEAVHAAGIRICRVRHHGEVARIEVPESEIERLAERGVRERVAAGVKAAGYRYVSLDLGGYVSGNLNVPTPPRG